MQQDKPHPTVCLYRTWSVPLLALVVCARAHKNARRCCLRHVVRATCSCCAAGLAAGSDDAPSDDESVHEEAPAGAATEKPAEPAPSSLSQDGAKKRVIANPFAKTPMTPVRAACWRRLGRRTSAPCQGLGMLPRSSRSAFRASRNRWCVGRPSASDADVPCSQGPRRRSKRRL